MVYLDYFLLKDIWFDAFWQLYFKSTLADISMAYITWIKRLACWQTGKNNSRDTHQRSHLYWRSIIGLLTLPRPHPFPCVTAKKITLEHGVENAEESFPNQTKKKKKKSWGWKTSVISRVQGLSFFSLLQRKYRSTSQSKLYVDKVFPSKKISVPDPMYSKIQK